MVSTFAIKHDHKTDKHLTNALQRACMTKITLYEVYKLSDKIKRSFSVINTNCKVSKASRPWHQMILSCTSSVNNWRNQWFTCSLASLLSKSFSRIVTSLAGHIFIASGQLFSSCKINSYFLECGKTWMNSKIWHAPSHECCSNSGKSVSGWSSQCACAALKVIHRTLCEQELLTAEMRWLTKWRLALLFRFIPRCSFPHS